MQHSDLDLVLVWVAVVPVCLAVGPACLTVVSASLAVASACPAVVSACLAVAAAQQSAVLPNSALLSEACMADVHGAVA